MYYTPYLIIFIIITVATDYSTGVTDDEDENSNAVTSRDIENEFRDLDESRSFAAVSDENVNTVDPSEKEADPSLIRDKRVDPLIHDLERNQIPLETVTRKLQQDYDLSDDTVVNDLPQIPFNGAKSNATRDECVNALPQPECDPEYKYRTINGSCNNLKNPTWGMTATCQLRLLPPHYVGAADYRVSVRGGDLPPPRNLSLKLHYNQNRPTHDVTHMFMFYGQLLDHDFALTPATTTDGNKAIQCCPPGSNSHPQCKPIIISPQDPFYSKYGITCLNFVRSAVCATCKLGKRVQFNIPTAFIDASFVYGKLDSESSFLRANDGTGRLRFYPSSDGELLPQSGNPATDQCSFPQSNEICFVAGDSRVNQHTTLASLQTIFLREHNKLCVALRKVNRHWDGDKIFEEARRIVGAEMQIIVYKEYLPILLGSEMMSEYDLWLSDERTIYNPKLNPGMLLEFTTSAFRYGHSMIDTLIKEESGSNTPHLFKKLRDDFFQPFPLYNGIAGPILRGTSNSSAQHFDQYLVHDVTDFLYRIRGRPTGLDLAAFNINRGRDHGLPTYVDMVYYCSNGEIRVTSFDDLVDCGLMRWKQANDLKKNYKSVRDVDSWPGIIMEIPLKGAIIGPTGACIIGIQFHNLKFGDRFYVEHKNQAGSFTHRQLRELKKMTLSKLFCLNTKITEMNENAMLFRSKHNPVIRCRSVKGVNLNYWRE